MSQYQDVGNPLGANQFGWIFPNGSNFDNRASIVDLCQDNIDCTSVPKDRTYVSFDKYGVPVPGTTGVKWVNTVPNGSYQVSITSATEANKDNCRFSVNGVPTTQLPYNGGQVGTVIAYPVNVYNQKIEIGPVSEFTDFDPLINGDPSCDKIYNLHISQTSTTNSPTLSPVPQPEILNLQVSSDCYILNTVSTPNNITQSMIDAAGAAIWTVPTGGIPPTAGSTNNLYLLTDNLQEIKTLIDHLDTRKRKYSSEVMNKNWD